MRVFTFKSDDDDAGSYRRWWHLYAQEDAGVCPRCDGTGYPALKHAQEGRAAARARLEANLHPEQLERLRCEPCKGTGRKIDERGVGEASLEVTTNRHGFAHIGFDLNDELDLRLKLAVPKVVSVWLGMDYKPLGFGWDSHNPLRWLFVRGRPEHAGGNGIREGLLGYGEREFEIEAARGQVKLKLGVEPHGGTSNNLYLRRRYPHEWVRDVAKTGVIKRPDRYKRGDERIDPKTIYGRYLRWRGWLPEAGFEWSLLRYDWRDQLLGAHGQLKVEPVRDLRGIQTGPIKPHWTVVDEERVMTLEGPRVPHVRSVVAMPEGNYPCLVAFERVTWGRRRWPWSRKTRTHADVEMLIPVPEPGKGENSWDIDDDATYALSGAFRTVADATAAVASSAMRRRESYGSGAAWVPDKGWPEGITR